jgi:hypothetical protein
MIFQPSGIIISLSIIDILNTSFVSVSAIELNFTGDTTNNFTKNLKSKIDNLISNALNDTDSMLNSSFITNGSNLTSNNVIISNNKVASVVSSNGSDGSSSIIKDQVKTINGVCSSIKVGGNGNDTLASSGKCNDELTGGPGADKFMCGDGNDTVSDYNSKEGDVILDRQNCEKIQ